MKKEMEIKGKTYSVTSIVLIIVLILALLGSGIGYAAIQNNPSKALVVQGSLKMKESTLNSKLAGNIEEILVEEGDWVQAGDPLVKLMCDTVEAKLQQAEGAQDAARAQAEKASEGARNQEVAQAEAAFEYAQKTYDRMKTLLEQEAISQAVFDQTEAQYKAAKEMYSMALEGARAEDKAAADALLKQAGGAVAEVNSYLEDSVIKAPIDGVVSVLNVDEGELISTGMPVATITSTKKPWVEVNVKETDLEKVHLGQEVSLSFPAFPDEKVKGKVISINAKPDFATKRATNENGDFDVLSYGVKIKIFPVEKDLYADMTVMVNFDESEGR